MTHMTKGVYEAKKKNGQLYYRAHIHFRGKHIALGSFDTMDHAGKVHEAARELLDDIKITLPDAFSKYPLIRYDKIVTLLNFRNNGIYLGTPIYLLSGYFIYYLSPELELKFDNDDLFYYSSHRILQRGGHLYINDYGMQVNLLSRYGIKNYAIAGVDYLFANGDETDFRYENIVNINPYYGVSRLDQNGRIFYQVKIHINGNYQIGIYEDEAIAAIAYNKAVDLAKAAGIDRNYPTNYVTTMSAKEYAECYTKIHVSRSYREYLHTLFQDGVDTHS